MGSNFFELGDPESMAALARAFGRWDETMEILAALRKNERPRVERTGKFMSATWLAGNVRRHVGLLAWLIERLGVRTTVHTHATHRPHPRPSAYPGIVILPGRPEFLADVVAYTDRHADSTTPPTHIRIETAGAPYRFVRLIGTPGKNRMAYVISALRDFETDAMGRPCRVNVYL